MKSEKFKVSIIIPVYNVDKYIAKCINSVINQTYKNIEIILVNDGSTDNSLKICREFELKDNRIKVIDQENCGVSKARNEGISCSTGDYICFSDGDDYLLEDYVEYLLNLALSHNADIALTKEMMTTFHPEQKINDIVSEYSARDALIEIFSYNVPIGVYCKIFKKSVLENVRFEEDLRIGEGFNFNTDAFQRANKVVMGRKKIYFYRRDNEASATTNFSMEKWNNGLIAINKIFDKLLFKDKKVINAWNYAWWHTNCDVLNFMYIAEAQEKYRNKFIECKKVAKRKAFYSFILPIKFREKIRAIIIMIDPRIIAFLLKQRNKKYMN